MKFFRYIFISIISFIGLTACIDDTITENSGQVWQQGDVPYYITLRLKPSSDTFTRAEEGNGRFDNFQPGTHANEHAISPNAHNFAIFFDENDKYISCGDLYSVKETAEWEDSNKSENIPATESTYKCRFYGFADSKPAKVLVVVNAPQKIYDQITDFPGWNLEEVMKNQIWKEPGILNFDNYGNLQKNVEGRVHINDPKDNLGFYTEGVGDSKTLYFTMTNSTYLTKEPDGSYKVNCAQEFPEGSIATDPDDIGNLNPVTVYLERMVSKFELTAAFDVSRYIPTNAQALDVCIYDGGDFTYSAYNWGIQLLGWGVNGLETSNYLFKNVPYEDLSESLETLYNNGWNSSYNRRCFWSEDPHYYKDVTNRVVYPWQYDDARDRYDSSHQTYYNHFHSYDDLNQNFALAYYPFQSFCPFINDDGLVSGDFTYTGDKLTLYSPENTFVPGLTVDRSRGSRAYELAGTHLLLCSRLLLPGADGGDYQPFPGNLYKNRVGISYVDEASMFKDFMNAVNYQLNSQKYLYYKYYDWDDSGNKNNYLGHTIRARSEGDYALYCYFPYKEENRTITDLVKKAFNNNSIDQSNGVIIELTHNLIDLLDNDKTHYQLYKDADAINADGKVIPWIMYRNNADAKFEPLRLMILERQPYDAATYDFLTTYYYDNNSTSGAEYILGNPGVEPVKTYLNGTQGDKVGLSTWGTSVTFDNFKVTSSQGELFSDDFENNNSYSNNWQKEENTATTGEGIWDVKNGTLQQTDTNMEGEIITVKDHTVPRTYTLEVDATPKEGREGFLIVFNYADNKNYCWWNVGGWTNSHHALEHVKNGVKTIYDYKTGTLIPNQKYHVMIRVNGSNVKCYLDGKIIHNVNLPIGREIQYEAWDTSDEDIIDYTGDDNDVQSIFYETWGVADCFKNGLMYYAVPIYAQDKNGKPAIDYDAQLETDANKDFIDDEKLKYYYGVVRNNWYKFSLHSINDIGIPVLDPTKPIVPNYDGKLDQNKVEMEIIQWHIEDQTVEIPFN